MAVYNEVIQDIMGESSEDSDDACEILDYDSTSTSSDSSTGYKPRRKLHRMHNFMKTIEQYDDIEFKENFRMNRSTCDVIITRIKEAGILPKHTFGREKISSKKAFYVTVWYLANTETFRQISDRFNITKSSAHRIISKIIDYLVNVSQQYIVWPDEERINIIKREFQKVQGICGIVGAIDGTHINIKRPSSKHAHVYYNRKGDYSILLQGVCDYQKRFIDVFCGEAGSMHDARVLKKSSLYEKGLNGLFGDNFLLGDSAYPCMNWLITPFKDNATLTRNQKLFNYKHSASRIIIENAFGLLKGRFRRLKMFENNNIIFIVKCVLAAAVLHNICIDFDDTVEYNLESTDDEFDEQFVYNVSGIQTTGNAKRELILRKMFS